MMLDKKATSIVPNLGKAKHTLRKTFVTILLDIVKRFISVLDTSCNRFEKNEENRKENTQ